MDRATLWLAGTGATWREVVFRWTFPSTATLTFGYLQTSKDKYRYQGSEFQFIGVDELTQIFVEQVASLADVSDETKRTPESPSPRVASGDDFDERNIRAR